MRPFDPALLRALPATRGPVALLSGVGVASGVVAIAQAVALAVAVDRVVGGGPLVEVLGWLVALLVLRGLLAGCSELVARRAGLRIAAVVRLAVLRHWLGRPEEERPQTDVAVTRATEGVSAVEPYVARYLPALVTAAVVPALAVVALLVVDPWSALIVVLTLPLLPVFAALIGLHTQAETERRWSAMAQLAGHFLDVVRGLPTLVAYGRARAQVAVVREVGERHRAATVRTLRTAFLSTAALELLATISVAMVAVAVGLRLAYGAMDLEVGLVAILLAPEAYWPIRRVGTEFHAAADGATALTEILPELDTDTVPTAGAERTDATAAVTVRDLSYSHPGTDRPTLEGIDLDAGPGLTVVTGPSGCGKTTLLELVAGARRPDRGEVHTAPVHLVTQRPFLGAGTLRANLTIGGPAESVDIWRVLREVGLEGIVASLPDGLEHPIGDDGFGLSAGQRARLVLARALLVPAPVVLLDEPTAHVDPESAATIGEVITRLARDRAVIAVSHQGELLARADQHLDLGLPAVAR